MFLIPFGFVFDARLLWDGSVLQIAMAFVSLLAATSAWAIALVGYLKSPLGMLTRGVFGAACVAVILLPTGTSAWTVATGGLLGLTAITWLRARMQESATRARAAATAEILRP